MFVKIQLRLLLIWGGGHRPLSVFSKRLLIMVRGITPYQQQAELDF